jgi:predicted nucleic acid-binding protein
VFTSTPASSSRCSQMMRWQSEQTHFYEPITPDAMHIAIAQRVGTELLTFDNKMAAGARGLGTNVLIA